MSALHVPPSLSSGFVCSVSLAAGTTTKAQKHFQEALVQQIDIGPVQTDLNFSNLDIAIFHHIEGLRISSSSVVSGVLPA